MDINRLENWKQMCIFTGDIVHNRYSEEVIKAPANIINNVQRNNDVGAIVLKSSLANIL